MVWIVSITLLYKSVSVWVYTTVNIVLLIHDTHKHLLYSRYIIRSDPLAHVPDELPVCQPGAKLKQEYGTETRGETHLWVQDLSFGACMKSASCLWYTHPQPMKHAALQGYRGRRDNYTYTDIFPCFSLFYERSGICVHFAVKRLLHISQIRQVTSRGDGMLWTKHTVQPFFPSLWTVYELQKNAIFSWVRRRETDHDCHLTCWDFRRH